MKYFTVIMVVNLMKLYRMPNNIIVMGVNVVLFVCVRIVMAVYYLCHIIPGFFYMFYFALSLQTKNWWHQKDEAWITNCSPYNAFICWILWFCIEVLFCILCIYGVVFICVLMYAIY